MVSLQYLSLIHDQVSHILGCFLELEGVGLECGGICISLGVFEVTKLLVVFLVVFVWIGFIASTHISFSHDSVSLSYCMGSYT